MKPSPAPVFCLVSALLSPVAHAASHETVVGDVRVQALSPTLVRIEQKGPSGFEDRKTLTVVGRDWEGAAMTAEKRGGKVLLKTEGWTVEVPENAKDVVGVAVSDAGGRLLKRLSGGDFKEAFLPSPSALPPAWAMADIPRLVPPRGVPPPNPPTTRRRSKPRGGTSATPRRTSMCFFPGRRATRGSGANFCG